MVDLRSLPEFPDVYANAQAAGVLPNESMLEDLINKARANLGRPSVGEEEASNNAAKAQQNQTTEIYGDLNQMLEPGGGFGDGAPGGTKGSTMSGPMNATEAAMVSALGALMGGAPVNPASILGMASQLAGFFGVQREVDPTLANVDPQAVKDYFGSYRASEAEAANRANQTAKEVSAEDTARSQGEMGAFGRDAARSAFGADYGPMGGSSVGPGGSTEGGFDASTDSSNTSEAGSRDAKRGGVFRASGKKPRKTTWGEPETGGETAVFIPENVDSNRKQMLIMALDRLLTELKGEQ